ncbi:MULTISPECIES: Lrp/AsnC family transcriptional regulator [unclassified Streptomyces]|uniref:Lrp/AsnC family transcriptional regulator n=1 Tax=unclassified Streptomyces TaxID=2593676 RepID=UPI000BF52565|nr:Lrp/AsnC family transcriptional regulator [Streptomyces sp. Ru87]PGH52507.1 AsnC family transcriptional regulator [Streptomyces sp. Ru87]
MISRPAPETIDDLDRRVIAALQLNGRAPWSAVARWAGAGETTVQRRYTALRERGLLSVVGALDLDRSDAGSSMLVRIQAKPGKGRELAELLAECPEARFLAIVTGTADLIVDFVTRDRDQLLRLLFTDLPGADLITSTESVAVIRTFTTAADWDTGLLPPEAVADLRPARAAGRGARETEPRELSELESAVVRELSRDGRLPVTAMARTLGRSEAGVGRALDRLVSKGRLGFRTLVEPALLGFDAEFMVWLSIDPARLSEAGRRLAAHPGTKFLAAATGRFNLVGHMVLPRKSDLFRYTDEVIGSLPGLGASDITLHLLTLKGAWTRLDRFR